MKKKFTKLDLLDFADFCKINYSKDSNKLFVFWLTAKEANNNSVNNYNVLSVRTNEFIENEFFIIKMLGKRFSQSEIAQSLKVSTSCLEKRIRKLKNIHKVNTIKDLISLY